MFFFIFIFVFALVRAKHNISDSHGYDYGPLVPMQNYTFDYRSLNGWECFKAEGKFCHHYNHSSMIKATGSSNFGHGMCCKPHFTGEIFCNNTGEYVCSQPVAAKDTS